MPKVARDRAKLERRRKKVRRRDCLRCDRKFVSEGPHNRLCEGCRSFLAAQASPAQEYTLGYL